MTAAATYESNETETPERTDITASDGKRIAVWAWRPERVRGVVQVIHGLGEHARRYAGLATALGELGYAVYASDHRGHGDTLAPEDQPGHIADEGGFELVVDDLGEIARELQSRHPDVPYVVFGHSMGSFLAQRLVQRHPTMAAALILSGSNGKPDLLAQAGRLVARAERARVGGDGKSAILQKLSFEEFNKRFAPNRTEFDWLSRDEAEVDKYVADPKCGLVASVQTWLDLLDAVAHLLDDERLAPLPRSLPIFAFAGSDDPVGGEKGVSSLVRTYRQSGFESVALRIYPGGRHEALNDTQREEVIADIKRWLGRAVPLAD